jgi:hypothetical protein
MWINKPLGSGSTKNLVSQGEAEMPVVFPHAKGIARGTRHEISEADFRQAWTNLLRDHVRNGQDPNLPRLTSRKPKAELEENGYQLSLEYLLRTLVPTASQNTAQATQPFLEANRHIIEPTPVKIVNPAKGTRVQGVRLLPEAH